MASHAQMVQRYLTTIHGIPAPVHMTCHIYGDKKLTKAESRAAKWKTLKNKSFVRLPPDADSLRQHCLRENYLYLIRHPLKQQYPSPLGHGWELMGGHCRPVRYTRPALPTHLPTSRQAEESDEDEIEVDDSDGDEEENVQERSFLDDSSESDDSESESDAESSDSD